MKNYADERNAAVIINDQSVTMAHITFKRPWLETKQKRIFIN